MNFLYPGAIAEVGKILVRESVRRVLFVVDEDAYHASGAGSILEPVLRNCVVEHFGGFELNPKISDVQRGIAIAKELNPDLVIALGGGTAIDLGKLIGCLAAQRFDPHAVVTGREAIQCAGTPLVAIPTTAGTGSEATHFAVVYVDDKKYSVAHPSLLPQYSIVDPQLTESLPAGITKATGLDAFCQGIESMWAVGATDESIAYATEAIELSKDNLVAAVKSPTPQVRIDMCRASNLAGKAINISKTTAPHALSYHITSKHGIPHGIAVALTLGPILVYNAGVSDEDCSDPRGADHVKWRIRQIANLLGAETAEQAAKRFTESLKRIGCPSSLGELGIATGESLQKIVSSVNAERMSNNPRRATSAALSQLLSESIDHGVQIG